MNAEDFGRQFYLDRIEEQKTATEAAAAAAIASH